jgi:flagellar biogenesis protein FliO
MTTETLRVSAGAFQARVIGLWQRVLRLSRRRPRRLRLCESLPLGERRFVAVVEFDRARFLVGGTPSSLVLLSRLADGGGEIESETEDGSEPEEGRAARGPAMPWSEKC